MKILVYDNGLCTEAAISLARAGHDVAYHTPPFVSPFPKCINSCIGLGLEGIERVDNFWEAVEHADLICFFDTFSSDIMEECRRKGKLVFGAGEAECLELDRAGTKEYLKRAKQPVGDYKIIKGITALLDHLRDHKDLWIKLDKFRGDIETFHHRDWQTTQADILGPLLASFGPYGEKIDFVVEQPLPSDVEVGFDGMTIDGEYPMPCLIGYENKDKSYIGRFFSAKEAPPIVMEANKALVPVFKRFKTRSLFSTEVRVGKDGKGYLIDPCVRAPHPPLAVELELYENFADLVVQGSQGKCIPAIPCESSGPVYGAAVEIYSSEVCEHWVEMSFDPKLRTRIKLQQACKLNGNYYALPGSFIVATAVGIGPTAETAIKDCRKVLETFHCDGMHYDVDSLNTILNKYVPAGRKVGILF